MLVSACPLSKFKVVMKCFWWFLASRSTILSAHGGTTSSEVFYPAYILSGMTETQRQLADVNERYQMLGDKLADRRFDMENALEKSLEFKSELQTLFGWLDSTEAVVKKDIAIGVTEKEASRQLQEHMVQFLLVFLPFHWKSHFKLSTDFIFQKYHLLLSWCL